MDRFGEQRVSELDRLQSDACVAMHGADVNGFRVG
jgi:hypothetical protein